MKTVFTTKDVAPRERFAYWHDIACKTIVGHESEPQSTLGFEAVLRCSDLAGMGVIMFENSPMTVNRTRGDISRAPDDSVFVCHQLSGQLGLEQLGRGVILSAGEMTLIDAQRLYRGDFRAGSRLLALKLPRHAMEARCGDLSSLLAKKVQLRCSVGALVAAQLGILKRGIDALPLAAQVAARECTLDLIALTLAKDFVEARGGRSAARSLALSRLRASIEMRLSDPDLDPASAARGAGIGVRYAQALLSDEGTSIVRLIHARRLEKCRSALADPSQRHRTITDVALGWGFSDMTHFGRLFKSRYGIGPRDYRKTRETVRADWS